MQNSRKYEYLVLFDLDGTLTTVHSPWRYLLKKQGVWKTQGHKNVQDFLNGRIPGTIEEQYLEFCLRDAALLKGLPQSQYRSLLDQIPYREKIDLLMTTIQQLNARTVIISAGFAYLAQKTCHKYGIDDYFANDLLFTDGFLNGLVKVQVGWYGKRSIVQTLKSAYNLDSDHVITFGDGSTDIGMFEEAKYSFACFNASESAITSAKYHILDFEDAINILQSQL
ncbi:MAG: HAD family hydrolase [Candidatus Hodarchaeota archaeon]